MLSFTRFFSFSEGHAGCGLLCQKIFLNPNAIYQMCVVGSCHTVIWADTFDVDRCAVASLTLLFDVPTAHAR